MSVFCDDTCLAFDSLFEWLGCSASLLTVVEVPVFYRQDTGDTQNMGALETFMYPQYNKSQSRPFIQCPPNLAAVGYSASTGASSLAHLKVSHPHSSTVAATDWLTL